MQRVWVAASLLWLAGVALRLTILATPAVVTLIQQDLGLSGTEVGILSGLPIVLFGLAALPGSRLIARFGALPVLVAGLVIGGVASGLRGAVLNVYWLYAATVLMGAGIAIMQPALPPLVRAWMPQRVTFGTALCTNGLLIGETLPVMLTVPLLFPLIGESWRWALAAWGVPLVVVAVLAYFFAPGRSGNAAAGGGAGGRWWPNWRDPMVWQIGLVFGCVNSSYFAHNAFLPGYLTAMGRPDLISLTLTALNFGQIPASFILLAVSRKVERRAWPFALSGLVMLFCVLGIVTTAGVWTAFFAGVLGFMGAVVLTLGFALPALLAPPSEVAPMAAAMFTISYCEGLLISLLSGMAWDLGGGPTFAFIPIAIALVPLLALPFFIPFGRRVEA